MVIGSVNIFIKDFLTFEAVAASIALVAMALACRKGCRIKPRGFLAGLLLGFALTLPFVLISSLEYEGSLDWRPVLIYLLAALWEEATFRGYPLARFSKSMLLFSSLMFALVHSSNPGASLISSIGIFLAAVMLGCVRYFLGFLASVGLHFSWNFFLGSFWGFRLSGLTMGSVFRARLRGPPLLTGGNFGPEASLLAMAEFLIVSLIMIKYAGRSQFKNPQG